MIRAGQSLSKPVSHHASVDLQTPITNLLLETLPKGLRFELMQALEPISLPVNAVLFSPEQTPPHVHFLTCGIATIHNHMQDGRTAEISLVGREGLAQSFHLLGSAIPQTGCFIQVAGAGLRMSYREFEQIFARHDVLRNAVLRLVQYQVITISQVAACNLLHDVRERLARWLLMVADRTGTLAVPATHEAIANSLGTRRSTLSQASETLARDGLIESIRGTIRIVDPHGLERVACECYLLSRDELCEVSRSLASK